MKAISTAFGHYIMQLKRGKAWKWFAVIGMLPTLITIITLLLSSAEEWQSGNKAFIIQEITLNYFFKFFILLVPLFFSTSVLAEEVEQQTIVYLFTLPIDRGRLLLAKFLASLTVTAALVAFSMLPALLLTNYQKLYDAAAVKSIGIIWLAALLGAVSYSAFSFFLGVLLRKPMLIGLFFVFPWEQFVQFMPGFIQKISIIYYVKSALPVALPEKASLLMMFKQTTSAGVSVLILLSLSVIFCWLAMILSRKREYIMGDQ